MVLKDLDVCNYCNYNFSKGFDMKKILVLVLLMCSWCLGAYDSTAKTAIVGGYGNSGSNTQNLGDNLTTIESDNPILADCTITSIKFTYGAAATNATVARLLLVRPDDVASPTTYTVVEAVSVLDLFDDFTSSYRQHEKTGLAWSAQAGDCLGWCHNFGGTGSRFRVLRASQPSTLKYIGGTYADGQTITIASMTDHATDSTNLLAYGTTSEYIVLDNDNGGSGFVKDAAIDVPAFTASTYYIVLEKIENIANNEDISVNLKYTAADGTDTVAETLKLDFAADTISLVTATDSLALTETTGSQITAHIWLNPTTDKIKVTFVNYKDGQGGLSDGDIKHISLTARAPASLANFAIQRVSLTQSAGTDATVSRIIVCRQPVLAVGDSFVSHYTTETILNNIAAKLDDSGIFTQQRYVINGGITGCQMGANNSASHSVINRWDSSGQDIMDYNNVLVAIIGGTNDIGQTNDNVSYRYIVQARLMWVVGKITYDSLFHGNDVVLMELLPYDPAYIAAGEVIQAGEVTGKRQYNEWLRRLSAQANVPIALIYNNYDYGWSGGIHPDADGNTYIAGKIAEAYENNLIATIAGHWLDQ
jgi:hypothetical protein